MSLATISISIKSIQTITGSPATDPPQLPYIFDRQVHFLDAERFRVELPAEPFDHPIMLRVLRVLEGFQQFFVPPDAPAIFGRPGALAFQTSRILGSFLDGMIFSTTILISQPSPKSYS